jgi:multiple sugar transport system substrate-binding protein
MENKKLKKFMCLILGLTLCFQLIGCSSKQQNSSTNDQDSQKEQTTSKKDTDEKITLKVIDWSDSVKDIRMEFYEQYMKDHPNINIQYTQLTSDQFKNTILTAIKSGDAPDLFPVPMGMDLSTAVKEGWFQPLDPYIDDAFVNSFADGIFTEGITKVDGKIYSIPENIDLPATVLFYNKKLFAEAGLDPEKYPETYSELIENAKKITEAGKGKYYGIIEGGKQINRWSAAAADFSALGGSGLHPYESPVSLLTGKASFGDKSVLDTFKLFKTLSDNGYYHPSTMNISAPEARALFAHGEAGFLIQGSWCISVWKKDNPDLEFGICPPPIPDDGRKGSVAVISSKPWIGLSANSKHPQEAADLLKAQYAAEGFYQTTCVEKGSYFSVVKGVNEKYLKVKELKDYYDAYMDRGRLAPSPKVANPETAVVYANFKEVHPNLGELLQGTVAGAVKDYEKSLNELAKKTDTEMEKAIKSAQDKGANVSIDDFKFEDWNPLENYIY